MLSNSNCGQPRNQYEAFVRTPMIQSNSKNTANLLLLSWNRPKKGPPNRPPVNPPMAPTIPVRIRIKGKNQALTCQPCVKYF